MFNKLKIRFVIINMSLLTFVFAAIFGVIFVLVAISGERQTDFALHTIMDAPPHRAPRDPMSASSIIIDLDEQDNIVRTVTHWQIEQPLLEEAVQTVMARKAEKTKLKLENTYYASLRRPVPGGTRIVLVDRTPQQNTLFSLLMIFAVTGGLSLVMLFFISLYLANRAIQPIKEAFDKQQQFIADASHELKTPLTIIRTNLSLLNANGEETVKSQSKWIDFISSQTDRLVKLVDDMLTLTRLDFPAPKVVPGDFNLSRTLEGELLSFEAAAFENKIALTTAIQPALKLKGDKEGIKRLLGILMDNAIKNTPEHGQVSVCLETDKNTIKIRVKNSGEGIPPEQLEKIFERFYRVDTSRARESGGYGLGLAIARSIVEQHQGKIYAQSNVGVDTTFIVELPNSAG